jgi:mannan endo-1,4-beta-mannosidase
MYQKILFIILIFCGFLLTGCKPDVLTEETVVEPIPEPKAYEEIPGVYLGTFHGTSSPSVVLFEKLGKGVAISASYLNFASAFPNGFVSGNAAVGRISFLTWEFTPGSSQKLEGYEGRILETITDGLYDDVLKSWADGARSVGKPVFLRFAHEMNGDWYPWSGVKNGGGEMGGYGSPDLPDGPERYVDAYRYVHDFFKEQGADNVLWVWCPNAPFEGMEQSLGPWNRAAAYYPGDDYVDWLCFDGYNWGDSAFGQQFNAQWLSFLKFLPAAMQSCKPLTLINPSSSANFPQPKRAGTKLAGFRMPFMPFAKIFRKSGR